MQIGLGCERFSGFLVGGGVKKHSKLLIIDKAWLDFSEKRTRCSGPRAQSFRSFQMTLAIYTFIL